MLRALLPAPVMKMRLPAAWPPVPVRRALLLGAGRILELAERVAQALNFLLVGPLLDFDVIEHFQDLLHVTQHIIEPLDNAKHFLGSLLQGSGVLPPGGQGWLRRLPRSLL